MTMGANGSHISMGDRPVGMADRIRRRAGLAPQDSRNGQPPNEHRLALLSLFDGTGLARVAMEEIVRESPDITLVESAFVEHDEILSGRVEAVWRHQRELGHTRAPHRAIARDVWDLFRDGRFPLGTNVNANEPNVASVTPLMRFTRSLAERCVVMIVAGSPCQKLTCAGRHRGKQGLCGPDSVLFFAVPTTAWQMQQIRPDLHIHVTLENASSMQQLHRDAIMQPLGGLTAAEHFQTMDSSNWSAFPRRRRYFLTIPDRDPAPNPNRRDNPWDTGWGPIPSAVAGPMMCSRNPGNPRPSAMHYHAQSLIYRYAENDSDFDWHAWPQTHVRNRILNTMPPELSNLYRRLFNPGTGGLTYEDERWLEPVMTWIDEQGPRLGYRVPTPNKGARSTGRFNYLTALRLSEAQLFNAVGNHFDPDALRARIEGLCARSSGARPTDNILSRHRPTWPSSTTRLLQR